MRELVLDTWVLNKKMNFTEKNDEPTFIQSDLISTAVLNTDLNFAVVRT